MLCAVRAGADGWISAKAFLFVEYVSEASLRLQ